MCLLYRPTSTARPDHKNEYKEELKLHFHEWYAKQVMDAISEKNVRGDDQCKVIVNLATSLIKPFHAEWIIATHAVSFRVFIQ